LGQPFRTTEVETERIKFVASRMEPYLLLRRRRRKELRKQERVPCQESRHSPLALALFDKGGGPPRFQPRAARNASATGNK